MKLIGLKTSNGKTTGDIAFYCKVLKVSRQGFYKYLDNLNKPWKYEALAAEIKKILVEDECNDTYGYIRMYEALTLKMQIEPTKIASLPSKQTVYRVMKKLNLIHAKKRKPNGITKADKEARKSDDMIKRDFSANEPLEKCVTDVTEVKTADGKLYISAIEDCFDSTVLGLSMADNMRAELCTNTLKNAIETYPDLKGAIVHSDRGSQYTSEEYRKTTSENEINQSMNSAGGRCHDNAKAESLWGRFKEELLYDRYNTEKMSMDSVKSLIWRYFMGYWNNRRICSANGGMPPMIKRQQYYQNKNIASKSIDNAT